MISCSAPSHVLFVVHAVNTSLFLNIIFTVCKKALFFIHHHDIRAYILFMFLSISQVTKSLASLLPEGVYSLLSGSSWFREEGEGRNENGHLEGQLWIARFKLCNQNRKRLLTESCEKSLENCSGGSGTVEQNCRDEDNFQGKERRICVSGKGDKCGKKWK